MLGRKSDRGHKHPQPEKGYAFLRPLGASVAVWEQNHVAAHRILEHFSRFGSKTGTLQHTDTPYFGALFAIWEQNHTTAHDSHIANYEAGQLTDDTHHYHITGTTLPLLYVPKRYRRPWVFNFAPRKTHHEDDVT